MTDETKEPTTEGKPLGLIVDWKALQASIQEQVFAAAENWLQGEVEDLKEFSKEIAADAKYLILQPQATRDKLLADLMAQVKLLGEMSRIRANDEGWLMFKKVLHMIFKAVIGALLSVTL